MVYTAPKVGVVNWEWHMQYLKHQLRGLWKLLEHSFAGGSGTYL